MAKQFNYFGGVNALEKIVDRIEDVFGQASYVDTLTAEDSIPIIGLPLKDASLSLIQSSIVVFRESDFHQLKWRSAPVGKLRIDLIESPVIEIDPGFIDEIASTASQGRIYCATTCSVPKNSFDLITRSLKKSFKCIEYGHKYWVSEDAKKMKSLVFFLGKSIPNSTFES
jgi:hypothetical protein